MAYRFFVGNFFIECDTLAEVRTALADYHSPEASIPPADTPEATTTTTATKPATANATNNGHSAPSPQGRALQASWEEARKVAKRAGRTDIRQVRSEILAKRRK